MVKFKIDYNITEESPELSFEYNTASTDLPEKLFRQFIDNLSTKGMITETSVKDNGTTEIKFLFPKVTTKQIQATITEPFLVFFWNNNNTPTDLKKESNTNLPSHIQGVTYTREANLFEQIGNNLYIYKGEVSQKFVITGSIKANGSEQSPYIPVSPYIINSTENVASVIGQANDIPDYFTGYQLVAIDGAITLEPGDVVRIGFAHHSDNTSQNREITIIEGTISLMPL